MRYWLATHYVHQWPRHPYSIYLKDRYRASKAPLIAAGDRVAFDELKGRLSGRQGIVALATVAGGLRPNTHREGGPDERDQVWQWEIPCGDHARDGFVDRNDVDEVLGRPFSRSPRVFGGVMELSPESLTRLEGLFLRRVGR